MTELEEALKFNWGEAQLDPDNWFVIPEFNVKPADVDFQGFALPIEHPGTKDHYLANSVRMLVRVARSMARARFPTIATLNDAAAAMWDAMQGEPESIGDDTRVAFIYQLSMHDLHHVLERPSHMTAADAMGKLASTAALVAKWAYEGATAAMKDYQTAGKFSAREAGMKGLASRWANDQQQLVKPTIKTEWEAWQRGDAPRYHSQKHFAEEMVLKYPAARNADTVQSWCREWKKL